MEMTIPLTPSICRRSHVLALAWLGCLLGSLVAADGAGGKDPNDSVATKPTIAQLMAVDPDVARTRPEVQIVGQISAIGEGIASIRNRALPPRQHFCIEDDTAGIWVRTSAAIAAGQLSADDPSLLDLQLGDRVLLQGHLEPGGYAPVVFPTSIEIFGHGELPPPVEVTKRAFFGGAADVRRVRMGGVVQNITNENPRVWLLRIETGVGHLLMRLPKNPRYSPEILLDAEVKFTGLATVSRNWRREFVCPRMIINAHEDFQIVDAAPPNAFDVPAVSTTRLDRYEPSGRPLHRRRILGTVTYYDQNLTMYLQQDQTGIRVQLNDRAEVQIGQMVEVSGFIDTSEYLAGLRGAVVRSLGSGRAISPVPRNLTQITKQFDRMQRTGQSAECCDGRLIEVTGRLLQFNKATGLEPHRLQIDVGDGNLTAYLHRSLRTIPIGSMLKLTGIADLTFATDDRTVNYTKPQRLDLLLRDSNDITVLSQPSWWTVPRMFAASMVLATLTATASMWGMIVRRTLKKRTQQLASEISNRRDAAIEFQATLRERTELAANLHDTVLQTMAGVAYQIEACTEQGDARESGRFQQLDTAKRMIQRGQDDLRNVVWTLHSLPQQQGSLRQSIERMTDKIEARCGVEIGVDCPAELPPMADFVVGNVLLVIQEAVRNATKHANARHIEVELRLRRDGRQLQLDIIDDGDGFDVSDHAGIEELHFGIEAMRHRIERLSGEFELVSEPGHGTRVIATVPIREFDMQVA